MDSAPPAFAEPAAAAAAASSSPLVPHASSMREYLQHHAAAPSDFDLLTPLPRFIRMNPRCPLSLPEIERQLSTAPAPTALPSFYALPASLQIADKACYKLGAVYGMDLASGLSVHVLDVRPGQRVLDLCAAPGNKLAMIADAMSARVEAGSAAAASSAAAAAASSAAVASSASPAAPASSALGSVVGVDWSYSRLAATRTLLRKYKHAAAHVQLYLADGQTFERPRNNTAQQQLHSEAAERSAARRATDIQIIDLTHQMLPASAASGAIASPAHFHVAGSADSSVWRVPPAAAASSSTAAASTAAASVPPVVLRVSKREKRAMTKQHKRAAWEKKRRRDEGLDVEDTTATSDAAAATETPSSPQSASTHSDTAASAVAPPAAATDLVGPDLYDRVLVDAECTHDGAHKHMLAIAQAEARQATAAASSDPSASAALAPASASASSPSLCLSSPPSSAATWSAFTARYFSESHLASLQTLQRALLRNGFRLLREGGALVYSTCSFLRRQNEDIVAWLLQQEPRARAISVWEGVEGAAIERVAQTATAAAAAEDEQMDPAAGLFRVVLRSDLPPLAFRVAPNPDAAAAAGTVPLGIRLSPWASGTSGLFIAKFTKLAD